MRVLTGTLLCAGSNLTAFLLDGIFLFTWSSCWLRLLKSVLHVPGPNISPRLLPSCFVSGICQAEDCLSRSVSLSLFYCGLWKGSSGT